jgi:hypothetical protein
VLHDVCLAKYQVAKLCNHRQVAFVACRYAQLQPLHTQWQQYAGGVLGKSAQRTSPLQPAATGGYSLHSLLLNLDLHGCVLGVEGSRHLQLVGLQGIVAVVNPDTLVVVSQDNSMHGKCAQSSVVG